MIEKFNVYKQISFGCGELVFSDRKEGISNHVGY